MLRLNSFPWQRTSLFEKRDSLLVPVICTRGPVTQQKERDRFQLRRNRRRDVIHPISVSPVRFIAFAKGGTSEEYTPTHTTSVFMFHHVSLCVFPQGEPGSGDKKTIKTTWLDEGRRRRTGLLSTAAQRDRPLNCLPSTIKNNVHWTWGFYANQTARVSHLQGAAARRLQKLP